MRRASFCCRALGRAAAVAVEKEQAPQASSETSNQNDTKTFRATSPRVTASLFWEDLASKTPVALDTQNKAKKYDGKSVIVTGSLDTSTNTIDVQKIEAAA